MTFKKFIIIFLLILSIFSFSSVFAVEYSTTQVSSDLSYYVQEDKKMLKNALHKNNFYSVNDLRNYLLNLGINNDIRNYFFCVYPVGMRYDEKSSNLVSFSSQTRYIYFTSESNLPQNNSATGTWYNVATDFKRVYCAGVLTIQIPTNALSFTFSGANKPNDFFIPNCWQWFSVASLFEDDGVSSSINNLNEKITEDNSNQNAINLGTHNDEMSNASDSIKNSNLYSKFNNIYSNLQSSFNYNDDEVSTLPISFHNKNYVLYSNDLRSFFENNNLGFVVPLWQSMLWFSLLYTMFMFIRKLYKAFSGGNPVDDVSSTLSQEDDKIVGGF